MVKADVVECVAGDLGHTDVELRLAQQTERAKQPLSGVGFGKDGVPLFGKL